MRQKRKKGEQMKKVVEIVHDIMRSVPEGSGAAADFTLGQGFDCEVLAELAHIERVYAFDVQEQAIADARTYLADKTGFAKIRFICDGHEHLRRYIDEPLHLGVFNFGYYPRGNKTLTTRLRTSAQAVEGALELLCPKGMLILVTYPGHAEGKKEEGYFAHMMQALPSRHFDCLSMIMSNKKDCPRIHIIEKKR